MQEKVAILGPKGTNGHEAAYRVFGAVEENLIFCRRNVDIFSVCAARQCMGIVPIENSSTGLVREVVEFWRKNIESGLRIKVVGEVRLPIRHALLVHPDCAGSESVRMVKSHPQALAQCSDLISGKGWQTLPALSTAAAAQEVMETASGDLAAIASPFAAKVYGLNVLNGGIHNCPTNETRFHIIGSKADPPTANDKTAIIFVLKDTPGALAKVATVFWTYEINLSSIISIPTGKLGAYAFYAEFNCHQESPDGIEVVARLRRLCEQLLVLGSYPAGE